MNTKSLLAVFTICVVQVLSADAQDTKRFLAGAWHGYWRTPLLKPVPGFDRAGSNAGPPLSRLTVRRL